MKRVIAIVIALCLLTACAPEFIAHKSGSIAYVARGPFGDAMVFPLEGSDGRTLRTFPGTRYAADKDYVYYEGSTLRNIDAKAFQALSEHHGSDGTYVYHRGERIDGADPSTFKVLNYWFGKDRSSVFGGPKKYPACDVATFQVLKKGWSRDAKCVFAPEGVVPELDAATFEPYSQACGKDKFGYFNRFGRKRSDGPKDC